jgi:hypothetical protein
MPTPQAHPMNDGLSLYPQAGAVSRPVGAEGRRPWRCARALCHASEHKNAPPAFLQVGRSSMSIFVFMLALCTLVRVLQAYTCNVGDLVLKASIRTEMHHGQGYWAG